MKYAVPSVLVAILLVSLAFAGVFSAAGVSHVDNPRVKTQVLGAGLTSATVVALRYDGDLPLVECQLELDIYHQPKTVLAIRDAGATYEVGEPVCLVQATWLSTDSGPPSSIILARKY